MKPLIQIALPTGHVYELATNVVAEHRAKAMQELHSEEFPTLAEAMTETTELFTENGYEIRDWALNQMQPDELLATARLVRFTPPEQNLQEGEWTYSDFHAPLAELDGDQIMKHPVESVLSTMAASNQLCNVTVLNGPDGKAYAAMALIIGDQNVVGAYITALQFVGNQITNPESAPAATH